MNIVGLSAFGDGSGASLVRDGRVLAAAEEARFTRRVDESCLPRRAVRFCLAQGGISAREVDAWVFYEKPLRRFERVLASQLENFPRSSKSFARQLFGWLGDRMWLKTQIASAFGVDAARVRFTEHQLAHAAGVFFQSPFDEAAVLVVDGAGEWATTSLARARATEIEVLAEIHHPHSLVLASRAVAGFLGFAGASGVEALSALAAHGQPLHAGAMRELVRVAADGHFELDRGAFQSDLDDGLVCTRAWSERFGAARLPADPLLFDGSDRRHADLAASFQCVLEEALLALVRELHRRAPLRALCIGGALAQDASALARIAREGPFEELYAATASNDAGAALGAALHAHCVLAAAPRRVPNDEVFLGEAIVSDERAQAAGPAPVVEPDDERRLERMLAALCAGGSVAWLRGRAEFGARALGRRVILADPRAPDAGRRLSQAVTRREEFLPYAPALPAERADEFFELAACEGGLARLGQVLLQSKPAAQQAAAAALDVNGRACAQLVERARDPLFHRLLTRFGELRGAPLLLSVACAPRGEPPVRSEREAFAFFERSALDLLVIDERVYARA